MVNVLVFGAFGQLGQCLQHVSKERTLALANLVFLPQAQANILNQKALQAVFAQYQPSYVINCAAYTAVDQAEDEVDIARQVNCDGVANLTQLCGVHGTTLIHISTDFVFAGTGNTPLLETDEAKPVSVYGLTKLEGEQVVLKHASRYFILRSSWLYSEYAGNFMKTMLKYGREREEMKVIWDQIGTPTYARDLAGCILTIIESQNQQYGIYHYSNEGVASWYDFAKAIFEIRNMPVRTLPILTAEYPTKAIRPSYSVMDKTKAKTQLQVVIPHWRESLKVCMQRLEE